MSNNEEKKGLIEVIEDLMEKNLQAKEADMTKKDEIKNPQEEEVTEGQDTTVQKNVNDKELPAAEKETIANKQAAAPTAEPNKNETGAEPMKDVGGDKENNALMGKECTFEKINLNNKNPINLFIYTNISNIDLRDKKIINNTRGCLNGNFETKILKEIKIINNIGYEQNNLISVDNNRYFYLIQVNKI